MKGFCWCMWIMALSSFLCIVIIVCAYLFIFSQASDSPCVTPNNEDATCKPWHTCTVILTAIVNKELHAVTFADASKCKNDPSHICCGSKGNYINSEINNTLNASIDEQVTIPPSVNTEESKRKQIEFARKTLLPSTRFCGLQHTDDNFYEKDETSLDEFPWLVYIPISDDDAILYQFYSGDTSKIRCTGFLISNQYVLAKRFCGSSADPIKKVYIEPYNRKKNITCIKNENLDFDECTDPLLEVEVEESMFPDVTSVYISSVRLIRLKKKIDYSDYIRPICLPLNETRRARIGDTVYTSGWAPSHFNDTAGLIKKRYKHTLKALELESNGTTQMCFSPQNENNTVCQGDDSGPVMYSYRKQWFVEGVINLEDTTLSCDDPNENACATRITPINIEWILLNMKP